MSSTRHAASPPALAHLHHVEHNERTLFSEITRPTLGGPSLSQFGYNHEAIGTLLFEQASIDFGRRVPADIGLVGARVLSNRTIPNPQACSAGIVLECPRESKPQIQSRSPRKSRTEQNNLGN